MTKNLIWVFDFTTKAETNDKDSIIASLNEHCNAWAFQLEKGKEGGYLHFQGRCCFKERRRTGNILKFKDTKYTPTSGANKGNFDYVLKEDTRVSGPWTDKDTVDYIPRQFRGKMDTLKPFQKTIKDKSEIFNDRWVNLIYCPDGGKGKSTIAHLLRLFNSGVVLPPLNDADRLIYSACDILMAKNIRKSVPIFIDLPRAMNKDRLFGIYSAIEVIKSGYVYDTRNKYREWNFDSPCIWVFTNSLPDLEMLSQDRWQIYTINSAEELVDFKALRCNNIKSTTGEQSEHFDFLSIDNDDL